MNITELARRLRVPAEELRAKLPELGFDIGEKALKVPDRDVGRIQWAWNEYKKRQYLQKKMEEQKSRAERKAMVQEGTAEKVLLPAVVTVRDFAEALNLPIAKVMQELMHAGILASLNERIDFETASIIAEDLGYIAESAESTKEEGGEGVERLEQALNEQSNRKERPPVIVVMGHVDHGKTKLLDQIRKTNVVDTESGGITQHIGAYQVERNDRRITFIDTPGHEAFTVMRSRGAKVADIAILVIAADDGIQPQTKEAIDIIKAAKMPFVVAINKIDVAGANVEKILSQLSEHGLVPEDWGGDTVCVPVSAKTGENIETLLDNLLLVSEMEKDHIVADPDRKALGTIIEAHVDKGAGPVSTILVQTGTLHVGDVIGINGMNYGKIRAMRTWDSKDVKEAPPSTPVKILGLKDAPSVGDILEVPQDPKDLKKIKHKQTRRAGVEDITVAKTHHAKPASDDEGQSGEERVTLNIIIKADVLGSLEAILGMIEKIDNPYVNVQVVSKGLGNVTDAEIMQAEATEAVIYAFNVRASSAATILAREKKVQIEECSVIYRLFEDVVDRLKLLIPAEKVYTELGSLKILAIFGKMPKGTIVGGQITKGKIEVGATARVLRDDQLIAEGK
ncbi:MAG: translation initiation factor IF-2, partial [Patescibacteria group bacterium]